MCFSTLVLGVEKPVLTTIDKPVSLAKTESSQKVDIENIQLLRLLKQSKKPIKESTSGKIYWSPEEL